MTNRSSIPLKFESILILALLVFPVFNTFGSDHYEINEELYVWAKNGLNLRETPSTKSRILAKLSFGDKIQIVEKTNDSYNVAGISAPDIPINNQKVHPLIFKGYWVKVVNATGEIGFVIDQYLLKHRPNNLEGNSPYMVNLKEYRVDTLYENPNPLAENVNFTIKKVYDGGITLIDKSGGVWAESKFIFPNSTIEEALIYFSHGFDNYAKFQVSRNWPTEVKLSGKIGLCSFTLIQKDDQVEFVIYCSC